MPCDHFLRDRGPPVTGPLSRSSGGGNPHNCRATRCCSSGDGWRALIASSAGGVARRRLCASPTFRRGAPPHSHPGRGHVDPVGPKLWGQLLAVDSVAASQGSRLKSRRTLLPSAIPALAAWRSSSRAGRPRDILASGARPSICMIQIPTPRLRWNFREKRLINRAGFSA